MWNRVKKWVEARQALRDSQLEGLLHAQHLQPGHYYLFIYDIRSCSLAMATDVSRLLQNKGIDNSFLRTRGIPPIVYDLKRPDEPVKEVTHERHKLKSR